MFGLFVQSLDAVVVKLEAFKFSIKSYKARCTSSIKGAFHFFANKFSFVSTWAPVRGPGSFLDSRNSHLLRPHNISLSHYIKFVDMTDHPALADLDVLSVRASNAPVLGPMYWSRLFVMSHLFLGPYLLVTWLSVRFLACAVYLFKVLLMRWDRVDNREQVLISRFIRKRLILQRLALSLNAKCWAWWEWTTFVNVTCRFLKYLEGIYIFWVKGYIIGMSLWFLATCRWVGTLKTRDFEDAIVVRRAQFKVFTEWAVWLLHFLFQWKNISYFISGITLENLIYFRWVWVAIPFGAAIVDANVSGSPLLTKVGVLTRPFVDNAPDYAHYDFPDYVWDTYVAFCIEHPVFESWFESWVSVFQAVWRVIGGKIR